MRAVNLIPAEQRESGVSLAGRSGGAALLLVVLVVGLAVLAFMYGSAKHDESKSKGELTTVQTELGIVRAQIGRLAPYTSFIAMANQRVQDVSGLVASRFAWAHAFHELGRVLPSDASLTSLQGQVGSGSATPASSAPASPASGTTPTSATPPGSTPTFTLSGCATSQSEVAQTLQRLRLIDGVSNVELQSAAKTTSSGSSAVPSSAGSGGPAACPAGASVFAARVIFTGLPSAPPTNPPAGGGSGSGAAAGSPGGHGAEQVSGHGGGAR